MASSSCPSECTSRTEDLMPPNPHPKLEESGFKKAAPSVWEYHPTNEQKVSTCLDGTIEAPAVVVLCPWTGAKSRHIAVYTELYKTLYPSADILVFTTSLIDICFRSSESKQKRLVSALKSIPPDKHLMMHVFSEGGSNKACELADTFQKHNGKMLLPVKALCLDSTPGKPHYRRLCKAFSKALPPWPGVEPVGLVFGGFVLGCKWIFYDHVKGFEHNVINKTWDRLLDDSLWELSMPRCYLFSERDELISSEEIQKHAAALESPSTRVQTVNFEISGHVQHARLDPERYRSAISNVWQLSQS